MCAQPNRFLRARITRRAMRAGKAVALFAVGFVLALLVWPIAWSVSAGLGYALGVAAIVLGAILVSKRGGATLPLVLGIVLLLVSLASVVGTAVVHMGLYAAAKAVEEATKVEHASGVVGQPMVVDGWEVTVLGVREAKYVKHDDSYYSAKEGEKAVLVSLRVKNVGEETRTASEIWNFVLVTDAGRSYERGYVWDLEPLWGATIKAAEYRDISLAQSIPPGAYIEGDLLFVISKGESPARLHFKVGIIGGTEVEVELTPR